jgi:histone acetyltransferase
MSKEAVADEVENARKRSAEEITPDKEAIPATHGAVENGGGAKETTTAEEASPLGDTPPETPPSATEAVGETSSATPQPAADGPTSAAAMSKNPYDDLRYIIVRNDGKPESMVKLIGLKSLFAKQLPKMPRAYIARLVLDRRHTSLAILADNPALQGSDEEIIGGICYRAFPEMRFAEIAFCAVNAKHQVKGYGTKLMNLLKKIGAETGIEYYITYADNYAIGYFKKQGFSKSIQMPKGRYLGLIKDYDGGTPMECYVHPSIDFTRIPEMLQAQRQFILDRISLQSQSRTVYPPLPPPNSDAAQAISVTTVTTGRGQANAARVLAVPGMMQAGWVLADVLAATGQGKDADRQKTALKSELLSMLRKIEEQQFAWPFREPVDTTAVPDYLEVIKEPIDLSTIEKRIRQENYYRSKQMLFSDLMLMVNNCKLYNDDESTYVQCAVSLENYVGTLFRKDSSNSAAGR